MMVGDDLGSRSIEAVQVTLKHCQIADRQFSMSKIGLLLTSGYKKKIIKKFPDSFLIEEKACI